MSGAQRASAIAAAKLGAFAVVAVLVILTIVATIRPIAGSGGTRTYSATFTSASQVKPGDEVRVAGVPVGSVTNVEVTKDAQARVSFSIEDDLALTSATLVQIRFLNLVGDRYVALVDDRSSTVPQPAGETIGVDRTDPALDLNTLLNGFKPLFAALSPKDVNALSFDIVQTLQGDGSTVRDLIAHTASLTSRLAERDDLINEVIVNLDSSVGLVADRHDQLEALVGSLEAFMTGLSNDRKVVSDAIGHVDTMAELTTDLLADTRPDIAGDIAHLKTVATTLNEPANRAAVVHTLEHVPDKLSRLTRTASYGSWFNYYICSVSIKVSTDSSIDLALAKLLNSVALFDPSERCKS